MLNVHGADDLYPFGEDVDDVLPALRATAAGRVRVGELVDQRDFRAASHDRLGVHLRQLDPTVGEVSRRHHLEKPCELRRLRAPVRFDQPYDDLASALLAADPSLSIAKVFPTPGAAAPR